jgi:GAF domain-containing protein
LLLRAVDSISRGSTLADAFQSLIEELRAPLELWHATLWLHDVDGSVGEVVAAWSVAESAFEVGTKVATNISDTVRTAAAALQRGEIVSGSAPAGSGSLVDALFADQGVGAGLAVPIHQDAGKMLVLVLGAPTSEPLVSPGGGFYRGLAAGIEARVVELLVSRTG